MVPKIILPYAALLGLLLVYLSYKIVGYRGKFKIGIGDGGNADLARAIRVQGNFVEYVPTALLLISLVELAGFSAWVVHVLGIALLAGRIFHAQGLGASAGPSPGRYIGTLSSWLTIAVAAILCLLSFGGVKF
ncbi:MAG TPA: MAPEG family protein [Burkholderiales bacterium]|nr:MAPEG family protein [Burkholderiales bacterium]